MTKPHHDLSQDEFAALARTIPMRDVGGVLAPGEKAGMAALGERWVLMRLDPATLTPLEGRPRKRRAIIYSAMADDVLDGRHRRATAAATGDPVSGWVGMDELQYRQWQTTGHWQKDADVPGPRKNRP